MDIDVIDRLRDAPEENLRARSTAELLRFQEELITAREAAVDTTSRIISAADGRNFTPAQSRDFEVAEKRMRKAEKLLAAVRDALDGQVDYRQVIEDGSGAPGNRIGPSSAWEGYRPGAPLTRDQSFTGFVRSQGLTRHDEDDLSLGKCLRGVVTGNWRDAGPERRAMSEGTTSAGGYLVPVLLSSRIIDLARNKAAVMRAGASIVPMPNRTLDVAKWTGDPAPAWHTEAATISPSDATLSKITLNAQSLAALTIVSRELVEDTDVSGVLTRALALRLALTVDSAALYGSGVDPQPLGVKNTSGITAISQGTNGAAITDFTVLTKGVGALRAANEEPNAIVYAPRTGEALGELKDTMGQPLRRPEYLNGITEYETNQVPTNLTQGTSNNASDLFCGDWQQLMIGVRTELVITILTERYADSGQIGLLAWWRGDVAVGRPAAFAVTSGITP